MKQLCILIALLICCSINSFAEKGQRATLEEEDAAYEATRAFSDSLGAFRAQYFNPVTGEMDTTGISHYIQRCLDMRKKYGYTRARGCKYSNQAGYLYLQMGQFEKALECFHWTTQFYVDELEAVITYRFPKDENNPRFNERKQRYAMPKDSPEYKEARLEDGASRIALNAILAEASLLFRLGRYGEAERIYKKLREIHEASGPTTYIMSDTYISQEELDLLNEYWHTVRGITCMPAYISDFDLCQYRGHNLYDDMLYLIERKKEESK